MADAMVTAVEGNGHAEAERLRFARERAAVDTSCRVPVLVWVGSGLFWLMLGTIFALTASIKLHSPDFLGSWSWLTFGRVRPAHLNTVNYGWASMVGVGVSLWVMARLARAPLVYPQLLVVAAIVWNVGVLIGTVGLLNGESTSVEWLEFPPYAPPFFVAALGIAAAWTVATFRNRREKHVYVSQWYLFGAMVWMPWLYTVVTLVTIFGPLVFDLHVSGSVQASANWWFAHNFLGLWITPMGLAAAYYLIPKVIGRPIYSYYLSIIGFWSLALFYSWAGMHHLIGGPIPAWMATASIVGSIMMFIPVGAVAINHHLTMVGHFRQLLYSPTLRFVVFGAMAYTAVSIQGSLEALRDVNAVTHFTHYTVGHAHLGLYGFFTMVMFGSLYYIVPRLTGWEWASPRLIRLHFWCAATGITIYFTALTIGGWFQGKMLIDATIPFPDIVKFTLPYLWSRSFAGMLMALGHIAFTVLFVMNLLKMGRPRTGPTYFIEREQAAARERELAGAR